MCLYLERESLRSSESESTSIGEQRWSLGLLCVFFCKEYILVLVVFLRVLSKYLQLAGQVTGFSASYSCTMSSAIIYKGDYEGTVCSKQVKMVFFVVYKDTMAKLVLDTSERAAVVFKVQCSCNLMCFFVLRASKLIFCEGEEEVFFCFGVSSCYFTAIRRKWLKFILGN